jgi:hypothetical protein
LRRPTDLHHQAVLVDVGTVDRRAGLDAEDVERLQPRGPGAAGYKALPEVSGGHRRAEQVITR